jgi:hypothetical protein
MSELHDWHEWMSQEQNQALLTLPYLHEREVHYLTNKMTYEEEWRAGQIEFLLKRDVIPLECPACHQGVPEIAARTKDDPKSEDHRCPHCTAKLTHCIALIGGEPFWTLTAGQTVEIK